MPEHEVKHIKRYAFISSAGYKAEDKSKKYNVLYLIHGTSENQNTVFGDDDANVTTVMKKYLIR
jgi:DNA/RNA endonuclease YhcR with UshA esterase domain